MENTRKMIFFPKVVLYKMIYSWKISYRLVIKFLDSQVRYFLRTKPVK